MSWIHWWNLCMCMYECVYVHVCIFKITQTCFSSWLDNRPDTIRISRKTHSQTREKTAARNTITRMNLCECVCMLCMCIVKLTQTCSSSWLDHYPDRERISRTPHSQKKREKTAAPRMNFCECVCMLCMCIVKLTQTCSSSWLDNHPDRGRIVKTPHSQTREKMAAPSPPETQSPEWIWKRTGKEGCERFRTTCHFYMG